MGQQVEDLIELHWLFDMLHHIDVGLVVLNEKYEVQLWNSFMENHSGVSSSIAKHQSLFALFPDLNSDWLKQKLDNVIALRTSVFVSWEQRPYLFPFKSYRPITDLADKMFQNVVLRPITNVDGSVKHVCMVIYDVTDVATNKAALSAANRQLNQMSKTDSLTELHNRSSLDKALRVAYDLFKSDRSGPHSLVMIDIDFFKKVNDQYGHPIGDQVLQYVAKELSATSRRGDFIGRFGGEEFAILLPNTQQKGAFIFCEKLRNKIAETSIPTTKGKLSLTISLGIAELSNKDASVAAWLSRADDALYQAKEKGRNQTVLSEL